MSHDGPGALRPSAEQPFINPSAKGAEEAESENAWNPNIEPTEFVNETAGVPPHLYRLHDEHTLWEGSVPFHLLSPWGLFNCWSLGEDVLVVTTHRVFICQIRTTPVLSMLSFFKPRYSSTVLRRRDTGTVSLERKVRAQTGFRVVAVLWIIATIYILSLRFLSPSSTSPPDYVDNWYAVGALGGVLLLLIIVFFTNDWVVTISHCDRKMHALSRAAVSARVGSPTDVIRLEEALRAGYLGGGGYMLDAAKQKKDNHGTGYVGTRELSLFELDKMARSEGGTGGAPQNTSFATPAALSPTRVSRTFGEGGAVQFTPTFGAAAGPDSDDDEALGDEQLVDSAHRDMVELHKRLLPGERLLYRCKHTIRLLLCVPVGNNTVAVTNKRLLIKKARYPLFGLVKSKWFSRYFFAAIPIQELRTFQHGYIRLFGRQRFIWSAIMLHLALLLLWLYKNEEWCGGSKVTWWRICSATEAASLSQSKYCVPWLPPLPEIIMQIPEIGMYCVPGFFFLLMVIFNYNRGWGLILDVGDTTHLRIEDLRLALSGPTQMNSVESVVRTGKPLGRDTVESVFADGYFLSGERPIGEVDSNYGKVVVTNKRVLVCRNHLEKRGFLHRWIFRWFRDFHVGSFDVRDVVACSTRWIPLHSNVLIFSVLWVGCWCFIIGSLFRYKACENRWYDVSCGDIASLIVQGLGVVLILYFLWAFARARSPALVFGVRHVFRFAYHRPDFLRVRISTFAVNQVQEWLRDAQVQQGSYFGEKEQSEVDKVKAVQYYDHLTILASNEVRLTKGAGKQLPRVGQSVWIEEDATGSIWKAVAVTSHGAVRLASDMVPDVALRFGSIGDEVKGGIWKAVPDTPVEEQLRAQELDDLRRSNAALAEQHRLAAAREAEAASGLHAAHSELASLRAALEQQTLTLIESQGQVVRLTQESAELAHLSQQQERRAEMVEVREKLLTIASKKAGGPPLTFDDDISPPPTPPTGTAGIVSPPAWTPPERAVDAMFGAGAGAAHAAPRNPLQRAARETEEINLETRPLDTPPFFANPSVYQL